MQKQGSHQSSHLCKATAKSGKPCQAAATAGGLCFFHANPNKAAELGRIGGRNKSRLPAEVPDPLPKLDKVNALWDAVEKLIADVHAGKLAPRVAAGLAPLLNLQFRVLEATDVEQRLAKVERMLGAEGLLGLISNPEQQGARAEEGPSAPDNSTTPNSPSGQTGD